PGRRGSGTRARDPRALPSAGGLCDKRGMPEPVTLVVAAGVVIERGRVLLAQRKRGAHLEGAWELPGGKVDPGEDPRAAVRRELAEELGLDVEVGEVVDVTFHRYAEAGRTVLLLFFEATRTAGSPEPRAL